ncbi:hypothetical protein ACFQ8C_06730 [Streptomyces sp. NPDC056503]|uniref:hypothetical protein n=1 Tax=Streptomyces sp. NPDC056503 TaxID=3345842 RepID=UPI00367EA472
MPPTPDPEAPEPADEEEPWLSGGEAARLWPVRAERLERAARQAGVRTRKFGGESRGTYGAAPNYYHYHPADVRRAAADLAEGRLDLPPHWRTDTPEGRRAERRSRLRLRLSCVVYLSPLLFVLVIMVYDMLT